MINRLVIKNYKIFHKLNLELNPEMNILVGNNESGKSTILEAIGLALTKRVNGNSFDFELSPFHFHQPTVAAYLKAVRNNKNPEPPKIIIEVYLADDCGLDFLMGTNNTRDEYCRGISLEVLFDDEYESDYAELLNNEKESEDILKVLPVEYFKVEWRGFDGHMLTARKLGIGVSQIDAATIRLQRGTDFYMRNLIEGNLSKKERANLSVTYRKLRERFADEPSIGAINNTLSPNQNGISKKNLTISVDISQRNGWESGVIPHLDDLPFQFIGKGEQSSLKIMLALQRKYDDSNIILIEEPENHQSFSRMRELVDMISEKCTGKQLFIATHSAYVINKLGLDKLTLLYGGAHLKLTKLDPDTQKYFKKLPGYDTLRLILSKKAILVEGPSDELIVQKAFLQKHGCLPIERGIDVINVKGLSFKRFLDIALFLKNPVAVVTDNDGDYQTKVVDKYRGYEKKDNSIKIFYSTDNGVSTLEPQLMLVNGLERMKTILGKQFEDEDRAVKYMTDNKTEVALKIFEYAGQIEIPPYINDAVDYVQGKSK